MMENSLLACPICGDAARMRHHATHDDAYPFEHYVSCCRCGLRTRNWRKEAQAVEMWNHRHTKSPEALSLEELQGMDGQWVRVRAVHDCDLDTYPEGYCTVCVDEKSVGIFGGNTYGWFDDYGIEWLAYATKPEQEETQ